MVGMAFLPASSGPSTDKSSRLSDPEQIALLSVNDRRASLPAYMSFRREDSTCIVEHSF